MSRKTKTSVTPAPQSSVGTSALEKLVDAVRFAQTMGGAIPVNDALVQLIAAAVVELA